MNKRILVRIDFQNDFVAPDGLLSINDCDLIEKHKKFANNIFKNSFDTIVDSYDTHFEETYDNTIEAKSFGKHCIYGTWGWEQAAPFKKGLNIQKIFKSSTNIWNEAKNNQILSDTYSGKTDVYLCGVLSDICVKQAMDGFLKKGANVFVIEDLCKGLNLQITDILQDEVYRPFIEAGKLKTITTQQFFRSTLLSKKIEQNLVRR
ncbi:MAG: cysteine hydrolase family protein [Alphaproteobacteria bacterium]|nr:cysteine hydrolase family protein [Alphaproteobacteria bacterium]